MKLIAAFFKLIRWPNLLFIIITQCLFYTCIIPACIPEENESAFPIQSWTLFGILVGSSVLIAAAGYIINDYFDVQIDTINRPDRILVNRVVKRRWAIFLHLLFSLLGIAGSIYISFRLGSPVIAIGNTLCVILLWFYSTHFKRQILTGNVLIAALTAWVIVVIYFFSGARIVGDGNWELANYPFNIKSLFKSTMIYAGFAFIISLIREVVKDLEDMEGDAKYNCRTMPIAWGVPAAKVFIGVWLIVLIVALSIILFYAFKTGWRWGVVYGAILVWVPSIKIFQVLKHARVSEDYHKLSNFIKIIMLAGILSMVFFNKSIL
jgi:4-hydroxybenzoate polyprenyltransferase